MVRDWRKPLTALLKSLVIGSATLTPTFDSGTTEYTAATSTATGKVTANKADAADTLELKLNGAAITNKSTQTWTEGAGNVITAKVTDPKGESTTYTVTLTYTAPES